MSRKTSHRSMRRIWIVLFYALFFLSCSRSVEAQSESESDSVPAVQEPQFVLYPDSARPGEPITVGYCDNFEDKGTKNQSLYAALIGSGGKRLARAAFFNLNREADEMELKAALLSVPSTAVHGNAVIRIESGGQIIQELPFTIHPREFSFETIVLNQENTDLRTVVDPKKPPNRNSSGQSFPEPEQKSIREINLFSQ